MPGTQAEKAPSGAMTPGSTAQGLYRAPPELELSWGKGFLSACWVLRTVGTRHGSLGGEKHLKSKALGEDSVEDLG